MRVDETLTLVCIKTGISISNPRSFIGGKDKVRVEKLYTIASPKQEQDVIGVHKIVGVDTAE